MEVNYKPSNTKPELLEIAAVNGVHTADGMTKKQIIAALDAHKAAEGAGASEGTTTPPDNEQPTQDAQDGTEGAGASGGTTTTPDSEQPTQGAQDGTEGAGASGGTTTPPDSEQPTQDRTEDMSEYTMFAYAGPSLPNGRLKENAVFRGKIEDVKKYLADVLEEYPQAAKLIVPTCKLGTFSVKVKTPRNAVNKYYNDIVSAMRNHKEV